MEEKSKRHDKGIPQGLGEKKKNPYDFLYNDNDWERKEV